MVASVSQMGNFTPMAGTVAFRRNIITTVKSTGSQEEEILVAQRKNRPLSPHLSIYQKQLTNVMSALHRLSGVALAAGFYGVTCSFAAASILGVPIDPSALVNFFAGLPTFVDYALKAVVGFPFVYHCINGVRHLIWDSSHMTSLKGVYLTGYITIGLTAVGGLWLLFCWRVKLQNSPGFFLNAEQLFFFCFRAHPIYLFRQFDTAVSAFVRKTWRRDSGI